MAFTDRRVPRLRSVAAAGLAAAATVLVLVAPSSGLPPGGPLVENAGITEPAGVVRDDVTGAIWVTDHLNGVCKVDDAADPQGLIPSAFCGVLHDGPSETAGMAYDPATDNLYVAEADSDSGGVWRMPIGLDGNIDPAGVTQIVNTPGDRVFGVALAPTGDVADLDPLNDLELYFTSKRSTAVVRVANPQGATPTNPLAAPATSTAGFVSGAEEVSSIAAHNSVLYLAEPTGITQLDLDGPSVAATPLFGSPVPMPGGVPSAVAVDSVNQRLYAGTANDNGVDQLDVIDLSGTQEVRTYDIGFSGILSIFVEASGALLVGDDTSLPNSGVTEGAGRIWSIPFSSTNLPVVQITAAPDNFTNQADATFAFEAPPSTTSVACWLDGVAVPGCASPQSFIGLAPDIHIFEVQATDATGAGPIARRTWVVDQTAPVLSIDSNDQEIEGDAVSLRFSANEAHVNFQCSLDGAPAEPCDSPFRANGLALGDHTFTVTGADFAGNAAPDAATFAFRMVPRPSSSGPGGGGGGGTDTGGGQGPRAETPGDPQVTPVIVLRARAATLSRTRIRRRQLRSRPLGIAFDAHETARYARITIQPYHRGTPVLSRRSREPRIVARLVTRIQGGQRNYIRWRLTRNQARRLTVGRYRLTVALGATRRSFGPQRLLTLRVIGRG